MKKQKLVAAVLVTLFFAGAADAEAGHKEATSAWCTPQGAAKFLPLAYILAWACGDGPHR